MSIPLSAIVQLPRQIGSDKLASIDVPYEGTIWPQSTANISEHLPWTHLWEHLFLMSEIGKFMTDPNSSIHKQSNGTWSGPKVADATDVAYVSPWQMSQTGSAATGIDLSDTKLQATSYKALSADDLKLMGQARRNLEALDKLVPATAQADRQRLAAWRQRLETYEHLLGDPDMDRLQKVIDHQRTLLQTLDEGIPQTAKKYRQMLAKELLAVESMQKDLNAVWHRHLRDLIYTIGRSRAIEQFVSNRTHSALSSLFWSYVQDPDTLPS
jgi:hypothetical protein